MKMPASIKKVLRQYGVCSYIHNDGIVVWQRDAEVKTFGKTIKTEIVHIVPFTEYVSINIRSRYDGKRFNGRIVMHDSSLLLDGINRIEFYPDNSSDNSKQKGITVETLCLDTESGMHVRLHNIVGILSGDFTFQNEKHQSIHDWDTWEYRDKIVWHGDKPQLQQAA